MFLQDFDLHFVHIPGSDMGPADALSHLTDPDISSNNTNVTLLPDDLFICAIDTVLRYDGTPIHFLRSRDTKHMTSMQPSTLS